MRAHFMHDPQVALQRSLSTRMLRPAWLAELMLRLWRTAQERRRLAELEPRLLRDIGVDPMAAQYEVGRPFWQLPEHHAAELGRRLGR